MWTLDFSAGGSTWGVEWRRQQQQAELLLPQEPQGTGQPRGAGVQGQSYNYISLSLSLSLLRDWFIEVYIIKDMIYTAAFSS